jgi:tetratricopeptide (TPR) repeat protein
MTSGKRKFLFSIIVLVCFLGFPTATIHFLEKSNVISTQRIDDLLIHSPLDLIDSTQIENENYYEIMKKGRPSPNQDAANNVDITINNDDLLMVHRLIPQIKPANNFRMLVVGASFAMGDPYVDPAMDALGYGGISEWVEAELAQRFPSMQIEIINGAFGGTNSNGVSKVTGHLLKIKPDALLILCGNNEGFVPKTAFNEPLHKWGVYRALKKVLLPEPAIDQRSLFHTQDPDNRKIEDNYRRNIRSMIELGQEAGATIFLGTLPVNLKFLGTIPKAKNLTHIYPAKDGAIKKGTTLIAQGKYDQALEELSKSKNSSYALRFMAEAFEGKGEYKTAIELYKLSVQANPQGRMRPSFAEFIRTTCANNRAVLVDLERVIESASPHGITSSEFFVDNCHLTWQGYYLCAQEVIRVLLANQMLKGQKDEPLPAPSMAELIEIKGWQNLRTFKPSLWPQDIQLGKYAQ